MIWIEGDLFHWLVQLIIWFFFVNSSKLVLVQWEICNQRQRQQPIHLQIRRHLVVHHLVNKHKRINHKLTIRLEVFKSKTISREHWFIRFQRQRKENKQNQIISFSFLFMCNVLSHLIISVKCSRSINIPPKRITTSHFDYRLVTCFQPQKRTALRLHSMLIW